MNYKTRAYRNLTFYLNVLEQMLVLEEKKVDTQKVMSLVQNQDFLKSLLTICIKIFFLETNQDTELV